MDTESLQKLCKVVRHNILTSTTAAQSGHPTSSLSAVELMTTLFFAGFLHYDLDNPKNLANDKVIFSKGHASPLLYSLYAAAGVISHEELLTLRQFDSVLEGHPTPRFKYIDVATGSLGQGLSMGLGMCLAIRHKFGAEREFSLRSNHNLRFEEERRELSSKDSHSQKLPKVFVLLGDSEMAEGQVWEALQVASYYKTSNLIGILDVNRLGQRGETMLGWDIKTYEKRIASFGWNTIVLEDGHNISKIVTAFESLNVQTSEKPTMIIAKTVKGKGVSMLENKDNWHGKALPEKDLPQALKELGKVDITLRGNISKPTFSLEATGGEKKRVNLRQNLSPINITYKKDDLVATREAYGEVLAELGKTHSDIISLDAETSNSTYAEKLKKTAPEQFYEMFIAEQNMVSVGVGFSKYGFSPFISTFAAFFTRAFDQIRMGQYSEANIKLVGSHAGVSIGVDGSSQMGLEDISMMRSILNSIVLYPSDAVSAARLVEELYRHKGISYLRLTREKTPIIYGEDESFPIGGSKVLYQSDKDTAVIIGAGITVHESIKAYKELQKQGINITVVDCYSVKPLDQDTIRRLASVSKKIIVVEDHYPYGGLGEAVAQAITTLDQRPETLDHRPWTFTHLCVKKIPRSGSPQDLLHYEELDAEAIVKAVVSSE
ncbi:MAG: transketolase [bacterium]|nr:transketolase [bacterium]